MTQVSMQGESCDYIDSAENYSTSPHVHSLSECLIISKKAFNEIHQKISIFYDRNPFEVGADDGVLWFRDEF